MKFKKVVAGGTFDYFHDGHIVILSKAFEVGEFVLLGVCSDEMQYVQLFLSSNSPDHV